MAKAEIRYEWPDGDRMRCTIKLDASYPDAIHEAKTQAVAMARETIAAMREIVEPLPEKP